MKKLRLVLLFLFLCVTTCIGCGNAEEQEEAGKEILAAFQERPETEMEQKKTDGELTVILHHAAFEEHHVIVDYTVEAEGGLKEYADGSIQILLEGCEASGQAMALETVYVSEENKYSVCAVISLAEKAILEEDVGKTAKIRFYSMTGSGSWGTDRIIDFDVEISKLYQDRKIEVGEDIVYEKGTTNIESLDISPFYTKLDVKNEESFWEGEELYLYEIVTADGRRLQPLNYTQDEIYFPVLPSDCSEVYISVVKYKEDTTYDSVSDKLTVEVGQRTI